MDDMDSDMVLEVPDTPDRSAIRRLVDGSSKPSWEREEFREGVNPSSSLQNLDPTRKTYVRRRRTSNHHNVTGLSSDNTDFLFKQARLAWLISDSMETKSSSQSQNELFEVGENRVSNESGNSKDLSQENPFPLFYPTRCRDSRRKILRDPVGKESGGCTGLLGVGSSLPTISVGRSRNGAGITLTPSVVMEEKADKPDEDNIGLKSRDKGKEIDLCSDSSVVLKSRDNVSFSPCNISKGTIQSEVHCQNVSKFIDEQACSSSSRISDRDNRKGIDLCRNSESNTGLPSCLRNTGQRRLVRNGCISPCNIEQGKNAAKSKEDEVKNMVFNKKPNVIPSDKIHIISPYSEGSSADKKKGKVVVNDIVVDKGQHARDKSQSNRVCSMSGKEVTVNADMDTDKSENKGWRTTHNYIRKASSFLSCDTADVSTSGRPSNQSHETTVGNRTYVNDVHDKLEITALQYRSNVIPVRESPELGSESRSVKGKMKFSSIHSYIDDGSSSTFDDSEISYLRSSRQPSHSRSTRSRRSHHDGIMLRPAIEVDELHSPEVVCNNPQGQSCKVSDGSIARANQVESDEILARQLQEQFYNETPGVGGIEEVDATIAWSLLQEDGPHASTARQHQPHQRDASVSSARPQFRHSSARTTTRPRLPTSNRMAQLRRNFNRPVMDLEMRLNFLEALEAAFDDGNVMATSNHILRVQRDFNENDYEMLLALDDNNHQHVGASESQINSLPQSVIQNNNSEEECAVCLELPSVGDTVRHLPCLHKFHKECIDTWLRRRMSCPICKSGIT